MSEGSSTAIRMIFENETVILACESDDSASKWLNIITEEVCVYVCVCVCAYVCIRVHTCACVSVVCV